MVVRDTAYVLCRKLIQYSTTHAERMYIPQKTKAEYNNKRTRNVSPPYHDSLKTFFISKPAGLKYIHEPHFNPARLLVRNVLRESWYGGATFLVLF